MPARQRVGERPRDRGRLGCDRAAAARAASTQDDPRKPWRRRAEREPGERPGDHPARRDERQRSHQHEPAALRARRLAAGAQRLERRSEPATRRAHEALLLDRRDQLPRGKHGADAGKAREQRDRAHVARARRSASASPSGARHDGRPSRRAYSSRVPAPAAIRTTSLTATTLREPSCIRA